MIVIINLQLLSQKMELLHIDFVMTVYKLIHVGWGIPMYLVLRFFLLIQKQFELLLLLVMFLTKYSIIHKISSYDDREFFILNKAQIVIN